ncbi:ArsR/SmtB family transcription factor [Halorubrum distributum]|uniref:DNA binding domain-containing protein n=1 Tax=Halorubrum distributum JCM 13916 TaxID=1230455 RepID=M0PRW0_9EURY|nr:helix-turn-helix domain-containing protein [Halorubrum arcis]EMA72752.1 DNA binding domain-containing protein [Halorubrum arcis JCM 13916]
MPTAFPYRTPVDHTPHERTNIIVDDEQPSDVLQTVSSDTAQQILATLDGEPATTSDIAEAIDTSIQNAKYHLDRLCEADLVEAVDTWYSRKGAEMTVYALSVEQLVVQFGDPIPETRR